MTKFWYLRIKQGRATIDDVPAVWRAGVQELFDAEEEGYTE